MMNQDVSARDTLASSGGSATAQRLTTEERLQVARQELILPWAARLSQFDHHAEVYIAGGAKDPQPVPTSAQGQLEYYYSGLNHGSDLDVIVISPRLLTPKHYVRFLEDLSAAAIDLESRTGVRAVFFCRATSKHARVALAKALHGPNIAPIHFLFYPSADVFYFREGTLAANLSTKASAVFRRDVPPSEGSDSWRSSGPSRRACSWKFGRVFGPEKRSPEDLPFYDSFASYGSEYP